MKRSTLTHLPLSKISRADKISGDLRRAIETGVILPGERIPGELELARTHAVSRTVVREAIAALRSEGLVDVRRGAGVFALDPSRKASTAFSDLDTDRISSLIELLELRTACEMEAAAAAAARRSHVQLEEIHRAHGAVAEQLEKGLPTREADFQFHLAIAQATQNRRFVEFLQLVRTGIISGGTGIGPGRLPLPQNYNSKVVQEHASIVDAITEGHADNARLSMRQHLLGSLTRYQQLMRGSWDSKDRV